MAKKVKDIDPRAADYIFGSVGLIFPRTERELDNFNNLFSDNKFDLGNYTPNPDKIFEKHKDNKLSGKEVKFKHNSPKNTYFKRAVLAAEITSQLYKEPTFGTVKLQKLMFLCENIDKMNINFEYSKQAAGPYDNRLMHSIGKEFSKQSWFKIEKLKSGKIFRNVFTPMEKAGNHQKYYLYYFPHEQEKIKWFIDTFRKEKTDWVELIATLYACWMELLSTQMKVNDESLLRLLYAWSKEKQKYSKARALEAIHWMNENNVVPER